MAKLSGPLLSFGARGQLGKSMVTSKWRGIAYARAYTIPANPRTTAQQENRTRFAFMTEAWKLAPAAVRAPWDAFTKGRPFTPQNKFVGENNRLLVGETDLTNSIASPGARGGLPPISVTAATGVVAGEITVTIVPPSQLPDGWTIVECGAAAVPQQDPVGLFTGPFVAGTDTTNPYVITLGGFTAASTVQAWGWVVYLKPDGLNAYSVSLSDEAVADS